MKKFLALFIWLLLAANAEAASRFWVGGTGTWDAADTTHWAATSGGAGGQSVPGSGDTVTFDASSGAGTVTVNGDVTVQQITCGAFTGTLDFSVNNNNVNLSLGFSCTGTGTRTLRLGNGTWTIAATSGTAWTMVTTTNLTFAANSSTIVFTGANKNSNFSFSGGALTYNNVQFTNNGYLSLSGAFTIAGTFSSSAGHTFQLQTQTITITNGFTLAGTSTSGIAFVTTNTGGNSTITSPANLTLDWAALKGITFAGAGTHTATNSLNLGQTSGITITPPAVGGSGGGIIGGF